MGHRRRRRHSSPREGEPPHGYPLLIQCTRALSAERGGHLPGKPAVFKHNREGLLLTSLEARLLRGKAGELTEPVRALASKPTQRKGPTVLPISHNLPLRKEVWRRT